MSHRILTKQQIISLKKNPNVASITEKTILYTGDFKVLAYTSWKNDLVSPREIFKQAGFPEAIITPRKAVQLLYQWEKIVDSNGLEALRTASRGRKKNSDFSFGNIDSLPLEDQVLLLKAQLAFIKELRA